MATARDLITKALRRSRIVASRETPEPEQMADGLDALNDMLAAWLDTGIKHNLPLLTLDTVLLIDRGAYVATTDNLALKLADDAGLASSAVLTTDAERGRAGLIGRTFGSPPATVDQALRPTRPWYNVDRG